MSTEPRIKFLSNEEVNTIYEKCVEVLSKKGVRVTHQQGLQILGKAGAHVDFDNKQVRFPRDIIESALRTVPKGFTLKGGNGSQDVIFPHPSKTFYASTFSGNQIYVDPYTNSHRDMVLEDVIEEAQLVQVLNDIEFPSFGCPTDMPAETRDVHALKAFFENTTKPVRIHPYSFGSLEYLIELAQVIGGGAKDFKSRPIATMICCAFSPLVFKDMDVEGIIQCCRSGVPVHACSLLTSGGTAPVTIAGKVLLMGVEVLAMIVMSQLIEPGSRVVAAFLSLEIDLATGELLKSSTETALGAAAGMQYVKDAYGIPVDTTGFGTDSHFTDGQAMMESFFTATLVALTGTADIISEAGSVDSILGFSPVIMVINNLQARMLKRVLQGINVEDETLAFKEIMDITPGESFMELHHTLRHCREALRPKLLIRDSTQDWLARGSKGLYERALEEYAELKKTMKPLKLPEEVKKELNQIVKKADEKLIK